MKQNISRRGRNICIDVFKIKIKVIHSKFMLKSDKLLEKDIETDR